MSIYSVGFTDFSMTAKGAHVKQGDSDPNPKEERRPAGAHSC